MPDAIGAPVRIFIDAPTFAELSIDCVEGTWRGVVAPPRLSAAQAIFWEQTLERATRTSEWSAELDRQYWVADFMGAAQCAAFLDRERASLQSSMAKLGLIR